MPRWTLYDKYLNTKAVYLAEQEIITGKKLSMNYNKLTNFFGFLFWLCCGKDFR